MECMLLISLAEFRRLGGERSFNVFSGATCACRKTLLGLPVCPKDARSRPQSPFVKRLCLFKNVKKTAPGQEIGCCLFVLADNNEKEGRKDEMSKKRVCG